MRLALLGLGGMMKVWIVSFEPVEEDSIVISDIFKIFNNEQQANECCDKMNNDYPKRKYYVDRYEVEEK